jgi:hypothetical protein
MVSKFVILGNYAAFSYIFLINTYHFHIRQTIE